MATNDAQSRWRSRNRYSKKQLNVMARVETHTALQDIAHCYDLRGKAEAVTFACFVTRWLMQQSGHNREAEQLLARLADIYHQDRDLHAP